MFRLLLICVAALFCASCASVPDIRHVVASTAAIQLPSVRTTPPMSRITVTQVSDELECMSDCLADDTCEACAETCIR